MLNSSLIAKQQKAAQLLALLLALAPGFCCAQTVELSYSEGPPGSIPTSFVPSAQADFSKRASFWIRTTIESKTDGQGVLKAGAWYMQQVSFFDSAGNKFSKGNHALVQFKKGSTVFYLHYPFADDKDKHGVTVSIDPVQDFNNEYLDMRTWQFVFASIIGLLFLLSASYSIIIRSSDKIYTLYAIYLFTVFVFFTYQYGILGEVIPLVQFIPPVWFWIFSDFITISFLLFGKSFLNLNQHGSFLYRMFNFGIYMVSTMAVVETVAYLAEVDVHHSVWYKAPVFIFEMVAFPIIFYRVYSIRKKTQ